MEQVESCTMIFTQSEVETKAGLMRLIDHLHIHVVRHSLIITYYKPAGETEKHKVTIIITKDPDCTFDR